MYYHFFKLYVMLTEEDEINVSITLSVFRDKSDAKVTWWFGIVVVTVTV